MFKSNAGTFGVIVVAVLALFVFSGAANADRQTVTPIELDRNSSENVAVATYYTVIDATAVSAGLRVAILVDEKTVIHIKNTHGAIEYATVAAGDFDAAGIGALAVTLAATTGEAIIGPLESARFKQDDGYTHINLDTGFTGYIAAFKLP